MVNNHGQRDNNCDYLPGCYCCPHCICKNSELVSDTVDTVRAQISLRQHFFKPSLEDGDDQDDIDNYEEQMESIKESLGEKKSELFFRYIDALQLATDYGEDFWNHVCDVQGEDEEREPCELDNCFFRSSSSPEVSTFIPPSDNEWELPVIKGEK